MRELLIAIAVVYVYFFPTILAVYLRHANPGGVFFVNLLLAWSVVGWFLSLIWALDTPRGEGRGHSTGEAAKKSV
ncbi:hypothetical protein COU20_03505 [Candidatus Kaiserbacteria bacterium CG10_big_fil_rev_8_21_14_0_10_59_10]|uniref:Superinfection immunity protein n=1 Tax=Candidatus Kaiserbacteria bacterium CG10_big_fil_rev_8_21_14_0_10_59_10 TaxID=1974612 RepID=A0A2H0U704_9BACT|nr:MAG: hypothetical protein COU20_03505 [Candidatus Kaiserbacteria bacterium CG10_big_fil_rev_8_21_14_0_10_59_10]